MSRIGRNPIAIPAGVDVALDGPVVTVTGPRGQLTHTVAAPISVAVEGSEIKVSRPDDERVSRSLHGLTRSLIANMVIGVTQGYTKQLEIAGTGYRVVARGKDVEFALGFSHPVPFEAPEGIELTVDSQTRLTVAGIDKQLVGETAARIRKLKKPEPYKGKGIHYVGETIRRKVGKAGK